MDDRTLRVLEYEKIKALLAERAASSLGKRRALNLEPSVDPDWVRRGLAETTQAYSLLEEFGSPPLGGLTDIAPQIARARTHGLLGAEELLQVADGLRCTRRVREYLVEGVQSAPILAGLGERLSVHEDIEKEIERCIDENANVRHNASEDLQRLNAKADSLERRIRERMDSILRRQAERGILQDPVIVQRAGRFCLPVQANQQSRFSGLIHDRSDSGATVFMEPLEVVEIGNDLRQTSLEIEAEVERILRAITAQIGDVAGELEANLRTLGIVDFVFAKGHLVRAMNASAPELVPEPRLNLKGARHPLIQGEVVPIDVWIGDDFDALVITGPNTGGKTVALKTVGLLSLMTQSGLHIPAEPGSEMTVWNHLHADIGDEQSIEQSLSTFSSHMTQIVKIINRVNARQRHQQPDDEPAERVRALVLLDEIGAGTDPTEGAALARAILTELHQAGCRTLATTHYNDLKVFAYENEGIENASVQFDIKTLQPTFKLLIGHAGSSNAFDIAQRLGLARTIVRRGREYLGQEERKFEEAMNQVERQQRSLHERAQQTASTQRDLDKLKRRYASNLGRLEEQRAKALEEGFAEAEEIVLRAEQRAREIIADLQRQPRQSKLTEQRRRELQQLREQVQRDRAQSLAGPQDAPEQDDQSDQGLEYVLLGDVVHVPALGRDGTVVAVPRDGVAEVQVGSLRTEAELADLRPPQDQPDEDAAALAHRMHTRKTLTVPKELDIRGMTVDEAIGELEKYLDDVALARFPEVRIIHGKGTGALRRGVHEFLRKQPQVREFRIAEHEEGGEGATEVLF